jgi:hypothetical protein
LLASHSFTVNSKLNQLMKLDMSLQHPTFGFPDPAIYAQVLRQNQNLSVTSYIHQIYNDPVSKGHVPWLTAADLALQLYANDSLSEKSLSQTLGHVLSRLHSKREAVRVSVLPEWAECESFLKGYRRIAAPLSGAIESQVREYENWLRIRCTPAQ